MYSMFVAFFFFFFNFRFASLNSLNYFMWAELSGIKSDKDWYFFCPRHYKYANSMRTNRTTKAGYWKITGKDWEIKTRLTNKEIGRKRCLVFYVRGPKSSRTQWIMHEYSATFNLPNQVYAAPFRFLLLSVTPVDCKNL